MDDGNQEVGRYICTCICVNNNYYQLCTTMIVVFILLLLEYCNEDSCYCYIMTILLCVIFTFDVVKLESTVLCRQYLVIIP